MLQVRMNVIRKTVYDTYVAASAITADSAGATVTAFFLSLHFCDRSLPGVGSFSFSFFHWPNCIFILFLSASFFLRSTKTGISKSRTPELAHFLEASWPDGFFSQSVNREKNQLV
jgi:hypothetical protein